MFEKPLGDFHQKIQGSIIMTPPLGDRQTKYPSTSSDRTHTGIKISDSDSKPNAEIASGKLVTFFNKKLGIGVSIISSLEEG